MPAPPFQKIAGLIQAFYLQAGYFVEIILRFASSMVGKEKPMGTHNLHFYGLWPICWGCKTFIFHGFGVQGTYLLPTYFPTACLTDWKVTFSTNPSSPKHINGWMPKESIVVHQFNVVFQFPLQTWDNQKTFNMFIEKLRGCKMSSPSSIKCEELWTSSECANPLVPCG